MTWRVFVGQWMDGKVEWSHINLTSESYQAARGVLVSWLAEFETDDCADCRAQAAEELDRLRALPEGSEFIGFVDGDDYLLIRADRTTTDELEAHA